MAADKVLKKMHEDYDDRFNQLLKAVGNYTVSTELPILKEAYNFSLEAHKSQRRYYGEPYFDHLYEVANILTELKMDSTTIAAGFLHDSVEDTGVHLDEIEEKFGHEIAVLVDGVTKIGELKFESREKRQAETFRKMLLSMAKKSNHTTKTDSRMVDTHRPPGNRFSIAVSISSRENLPERSIPRTYPLTGNCPRKSASNPESWI